MTLPPAPSRLDAAVLHFHGIPYRTWLRMSLPERARLTDQYYAATGATR